MLWENRNQNNKDTTLYVYVYGTLNFIIIDKNLFCSYLFLHFPQLKLTNFLGEFWRSFYEIGCLFLFFF